MKQPKRIALIASDYPLYEQYCPHFSGMQDGLKALGIEHKLFSCRPNIDTDAIIAYKPDLVIYCLLDMVKHQAWRMRIRKGLPDAKIVMWYGDLRNEQTGQITANMGEIDMMFISNDAQAEYYQRKWLVRECKFLPLGATIKSPDVDPKFAFDFVFIGARITGSAFTNRVVEIGKYKHHGLNILNADAQSQPDLRAKILKMMPTIYRSSKLCLDISHFTDIDSYTSNRFWNIPASGGVALTKRFPNCEKFYPKDSRIYFDTFEESIKLKDYYLKHPQKLEAIRQKSIEVAKLHTYDKRFAEMFLLLYN